LSVVCLLFSAHERCTWKNEILGRRDFEAVGEELRTWVRFRTGQDFITSAMGCNLSMLSFADREDGCWCPTGRGAFSPYSCPSTSGCWDVGEASRMPPFVICGLERAEKAVNYKTPRWVPVAHICNPSYLEG
jgi:hypothetical protein